MRHYVTMAQVVIVFCLFSFVTGEAFLGESMVPKQFEVSVAFPFTGTANLKRETCLTVMHVQTRGVSHTSRERVKSHDINGSQHG